MSPVKERVRPQTAKTELGVPGYKVPKSLHFHNSPSFSITKDTSSYFDLETRHLKKNPGPGTYNLRHVMTKKEEAELVRKRREKVDLEKLPKRPMFMDEDLRRAKAMPAPGQYLPKKLDSATGNIEMKLDRISYLDEAIRDK